MQTEFQIIDLEAKLRAKQEVKHDAQPAIDTPASPDTSERNRQASTYIAELKEQIRALEIKRDALKGMLSRFDDRRSDAQAIAIQSAFLQDELASLRAVSDQVDLKLAQLRFTQDRAPVAIPRIDLAQVPRAPFRDHRLVFMALVPVAVLIGLLAVSLISRLAAHRGRSSGPVVAGA